MDSKSIFRKYNKEWNKIQREKKRQDKAFKRLNAIMERDMVEPYLCDCKHCKAKRIRPFQMY